MKPTRIEVHLPKEVNETIAAFWKTHGRLGRAMISQPVFRGNGYALKIRMMSVSEAERLWVAFNDIFKQQ